eukprot:GHVU01198903.1.p1 GENE.GHVU01198903.1~~GHVU01198903.1.p1  ORF type:complete len:176 (-),score=5.29 GHVU01198903.1:621-1148(-)
MEDEVRSQRFTFNSSRRLPLQASSISVDSQSQPVHDHTSSTEQQIIISSSSSSRLALPSHALPLLQRTDYAFTVDALDISPPSAGSTTIILTVLRGTICVRQYPHRHYNELRVRFTHSPNLSHEDSTTIHKRFSDVLCGQEQQAAEEAQIRRQRIRILLFSPPIILPVWCAHVAT